MRWSLYWQLLVPMITVLVLAIGLASLTSAYLGISSVRQLQEDQLRRAVDTLSRATFPLTQPVLQSIRSLTGAEYVVLSADNRVQSATLNPGEEVLTSLRDLHGPAALDDLSQQPLVRVGRQQYFAARIPIQRRAGGEGQSVLVLVPQSGPWSDARQAAWPPLIAGSVALVVSLLMTAAIARRILRPVRRLGDQAEQIAAGDFRPVPLPKPNDEIRDLSESINRMAARLEAHTEHVRRSERLRALDLLSSGLAHQLRNSIMGARIAIELHRRHCPAAEDESIGVSLSQLTLMESYLQRFLALGKADPGTRSPVELGAFLDELLELVRPACRHAGIRLELAAAETRVWVEADPELMRQMLTNLLLNALEAARTRGAAGQVCVQYGNADGEAFIRVGDSGAGPAEQLRDSMFEPFVSDKPDGTGLGLAVARQIAVRHRGAIDWRRIDDMTWFTVRLPVHLEPQS
jgi:signal transduction histidine kinase